MVSVLIITRYRTPLLKKCLASLAPWADKIPLQVVVLVNGPDQATEDYLASLSMKGLEYEVFAKQLLPGASRNAGLLRLKHEWTFFIDDDAEVPSGYLEYWLKSVHSLPEAQVIGGTDAAPPHECGLARAVSLTLASPLCTGATYKRHRERGFKAEKADETSLTSCNLWVRTHWWFKGVKFPEDYRRGEETVLLQELKKRTPEIWSIPALQVWHTRRKNWGELAYASRWGGFYRARALRERGGPMWFYLAPVFVLLHLSFIAMPPFFIFFICAWLIASTLASFHVCFEGKALKYVPLVIALHWWILFTYGLGFLQYLSEWAQEA